MGGDGNSSIYIFDVNDRNNQKTNESLDIWDHSANLYEKDVLIFGGYIDYTYSDRTYLLKNFEPD